MAKNDYAARYTKPELRERLKEKIRKGAKGGRAGQWSARKSQLLAVEYQREGGGFKDDPGQARAANRLRRWSKQEKETGDGATRARDGKKTAV